MGVCACVFVYVCVCVCVCMCVCACMCVRLCMHLWSVFMCCALMCLCVCVVWGNSFPSRDRWNLQWQNFVLPTEINSCPRSIGLPVELIKIPPKYGYEIRIDKVFIN